MLQFAQNSTQKKEDVAVSRKSHRHSGTTFVINSFFCAHIVRRLNGRIEYGQWHEAQALTLGAIVAFQVVGEMETQTIVSSYFFLFLTEVQFCLARVPDFFWGFSWPNPFRNERISFPVYVCREERYGTIELLRIISLLVRFCVKS